MAHLSGRPVAAGDAQHLLGRWERAVHSLRWDYLPRYLGGHRPTDSGAHHVRHRAPPDEDPIGLVRISSSFNEVSEAGDTFRGEAVIETIAYDGTVLESFPVSVVGTRITVQPPAGTPTAATGEMPATPTA